MKNKLNHKLFGFLLLFVLIVFSCSISTSANSKSDDNSKLSSFERNDLNDIESVTLNSQLDDVFYGKEIEGDTHCQDYIQLDFEERPYSLLETAYLFFSVNSSSQVKNVQYEYVGFDIIETNTVKSSIKIGVKFNENVDAMSLKLIVKLSDDNVLVSNIYGYQSNELYFLSRASEENVDLLYYDYALRTNKISNEDYEEILLEKSCLAEEKIDVSNEIQQTSLYNSNNQTSVLANGYVDSYVSGRWQWHDGKNYHPLKNTLVNIFYPRKGLADSAYVSCSTYTDENGYFSATLWITEPVEVQVRVRSEGKTTLVRKNSLSSSYIVSS